MFYGIKKDIPKGMDIYHAVEPASCMYLPPDKTIVTVLDMIPWLYPHLSGSGQQKNFITRIVGKQAFRMAYNAASKCARIATISEQGRQEVIKYLKYPESKVKLIRLGINPDLEPEPKKDKTFRIGYLGQLDKRKRVDILINAFKESNIDGELVIAGEGVDLPKLFALANGDKRIKFLGFVPDNRLKEFYNSLDLFAFPTAIEGYGLPIVEAMACKKKVLIATDSIIPDELKKRCYYLGDHVFELNQYHLGLPSIKENNYPFAKLHDWGKTVSEYEILYRSVLNEQ